MASPWAGSSEGKPSSGGLHEAGAQEAGFARSEGGGQKLSGELLWRGLSCGHGPPGAGMVPPLWPLALPVSRLPGGGSD